MEVWLFALTSVLIVSLISLIGIVTLTLKTKKLEDILHFLVSFAVGGLFGDAFIHLIPQAYEKIGSSLAVSMLILSGILLFLILERFIRWRHCHIPTSANHPHPVVFMNLIGDGVHNFFDGMVIAASYQVSFQVGFATTLAVILHEIPQEIGDFGVLLNGGLSVRKALSLNFLMALTSIFGALVALIIGPNIKDFALFLLPVTAGGFIYMAGSDLIPELHENTNDAGVSFWQLLFVLAGISIMALLLIFE